MRSRSNRSSPWKFFSYVAEESQDGWVVSLPSDDGKGLLLTPSGAKYQLVEIGSGTFVTAYEIVENGFVLIEVHDVDGRQMDYTKTLLSQILQEGHQSPYLPQIVYAGDTSNSQLFMMPKYKVPLTKSKKTAEAYRLSEVLRNCAEEATNRVFQQNKSLKRGWEKKVREETLSCLLSQDLPHALTDALHVISEYADLYSQHALFEFPERNLGTDSAGNLILLDVLFDNDAAWAVQDLGRSNGMPNIVRALEGLLL